MTAMTQTEKESYLADLHVGVLAPVNGYQVLGSGARQSIR